MTSEGRPHVVEKLNRLSESHGELRFGTGLATAVSSDQEWPERYGVLGDYVPNGFVKQQAFPFTWDSDPPPPPGATSSRG